MKHMRIVEARCHFKSQCNCADLQTKILSIRKVKGMPDVLDSVCESGQLLLVASHLRLQLQHDRAMT